MIELNLIVPSLKTTEVRNYNHSYVNANSSSIFGQTFLQRDCNTNVALDNLRSEIARVNKELEELEASRPVYSAKTQQVPNEEKSLKINSSNLQNVINARKAIVFPSASSNLQNIANKRKSIVFPEKNTVVTPKAETKTVPAVVTPKAEAKTAPAVVTPKAETKTAPAVVTPKAEAKKTETSAKPVSAKPSVVDTINEQKKEKSLSGKIMSSYGKVVSVENLENVYNKELAEKLAKQSMKEAAGRTKSTGWCAKCVNDALEKAGLVIKNSTRRASAFMLERVFDNNKSFKRVNVKREELAKLPAGCVVVWQNGSGFGNAFAKHGHIFVTQGNGKATSDYVQDMKDYKSDFAVYVPVNA